MEVAGCSHGGLGRLVKVGEIRWRPGRQEGSGVQGQGEQGRLGRGGRCECGWTHECSYTSGE